MHKIPDCDRCLMCAHDPSLVCAVHPYGPSSDNCLDFRADPDLENIRFQDFLGLQRQPSENTNADEPYSNPYSLDPDEEQWEPDGASYYNGELIRQPSQQRTREEQLWLLDNHPLFTSVCPQCKYHFPQANCHIVHFDCPSCGWVDDSV
ncbi:hypothetical protein [Aliterella atlantica]|uniref:Uncharacterized protein n=1 Tax=Aliterella atlantica CENA595 TaxID=1618023 RepID=A0A0D8ZPL3_9CYAN|nr:hypothetical protein [Aliterella atlantica]KJH70277.1 hypothetical protein UH38_19225 [Aliterella atlantica CENA595]